MTLQLTAFISVTFKCFNFYSNSKLVNPILDMSSLTSANTDVPAEETGTASRALKL